MSGHRVRSFLTGIATKHIPAPSTRPWAVDQLEDVFTHSVAMLTKEELVILLTQRNHENGEKLEYRTNNHWNLIMSEGCDDEVVGDCTHPWPKLV
jgi:hypothetical protein